MPVGDSKDQIETLRNALVSARQAVHDAANASARMHNENDANRYWKARSEMLRLERELAAAFGDEYAIGCDFPVEWDCGAPMPHLLMSDNLTYLIFVLNEPDPRWDGSYVTLRDSSSGAIEPLAAVEFLHCRSAKLGAPNDEVFHGHPLYGKGQEAYTAQIVANSKWIMELQRINSVHHGYDPKRWSEAKHYVFWFHDTTFECIANSFKLELFKCSIPDLLAHVAQKLAE